MPRLTETTEVRVTPRQVMAYLSDAGNLPNYLPASRVEVLERDERRARIRHDLTVAGRTLDLVCLLEADPSGRRLTCRAVEGMTFECTWVLQQLHDGTQITCIMEYQPPGGFLGKLADAFGMRKGMQAMCGQALQRLKSELEA